MMEIRFERHRGIHCRTGETVDLPQCRIFVDGRLVGYVGDQPKAPVCFIQQEPPAIAEAVRLAFLAQRNEEPGPASMPPPVELIDDYHDADEESDE